jgi:hypothetical protein
LRPLGKAILATCRRAELKPIAQVPLVPTKNTITDEASRRNWREAAEGLPSTARSISGPVLRRLGDPPDGAPIGAIGVTGRALEPLTQQADDPAHAEVTSCPEPRRWSFRRKTLRPPMRQSPPVST